jgi:nucleotide-binding universal stress UspA family protein
VSVYPRVIIGTDGSQTAAEAVRRAALLAERLGSALLVVTAYTRPRPDEMGPQSMVATQPEEALFSAGYRGAAECAQDAATMVAKMLPDLKVDTATPEGEPAEELLATAERYPGALLAVGSQGMTGSKRFLLGSVPNKVSHHMAEDLLILRTGIGRPLQAPQSVLAATDGSGTASYALERAIAVAKALGAALTVLTVSDDAAGAREVLDAAAARVEAAGVACRAVVRGGDPAEAIIAEGEGHGLVVLGSRGMTGASRFLLGSVPNKVSHHGVSDLLIVKTA